MSLAFLLGSALEEGAKLTDFSINRLTGFLGHLPNLQIEDDLGGHAVGNVHHLAQSLDRFAIVGRVPDSLYDVKPTFDCFTNQSQDRYSLLGSLSLVRAHEVIVPIRASDRSVGPAMPKDLDSKLWNV